MDIAYVLDNQGNPLMPTKRLGRVRHLLQEDKAEIACYKPFTIQLKYESTHFVQDLYVGIDPGRTNIGLAVVNGKGEVFYAANVTTRNREIPKLMTDRAQHRKASRRGQRLVRKRLAKRNNTLTEFPNGRKLPGYKDGNMPVKDIINKESRFNNRKRSARWLTPTANQCVRTHINLAKHINNFLPIKSWTMEYNKFAFMQLDDGSVLGADFQNGTLKGYARVEDYVFDMQGGCCALCGKPMDKNNYHCHHIDPQSKGGSDKAYNRIGLCDSCHGQLHQNEAWLEEKGKRKKYAGTSIINIAMPFIYEGLVQLFGDDNVHICSGFDTAHLREYMHMPKDHFADAICIACIGAHIEPKYDNDKHFEIHQFRCHNRSLIHSQTERTYRYKGEIVAKNRTPRFEQKGDSLSQWRIKMAKQYGEAKAQRMVSQLEVTKSMRRYNSLKRAMPGSIFIYQGKSFVLTGQLSKGLYYRAFGQGKKNFPAKECKILGRRSLVYV